MLVLRRAALPLGPGPKTVLAEGDSWAGDRSPLAAGEHAMLAATCRATMFGCGCMPALAARKLRTPARRSGLAGGGGTGGAAPPRPHRGNVPPWPGARSLDFMARCRRSWILDARRRPGAVQRRLSGRGGGGVYRRPGAGGRSGRASSPAQLGPIGTPARRRPRLGPTLAAAGGRFAIRAARSGAGERGVTIIAARLLAAYSTDLDDSGRPRPSPIPAFLAWDLPTSLARWATGVCWPARAMASSIAPSG
jgi:hypothetical protein